MYGREQDRVSKIDLLEEEELLSILDEQREREEETHIQRIRMR